MCKMCQEAPFAPGINSHPAIFFFELIGRYEVVGYLYIYSYIYIYICGRQGQSFGIQEGARPRLTNHP